MPISTPVPQEYAKPFDAKTPSTYDQYVAFTGPVHVQERQLGQARRPQAGRAASSWCATPTGIRRPTTAPPTWTRSRSRRATTTPSPRRGASSRARRSCRATARRPAPVIKQALSRNKDQIAFIPGGGYRMIAMNSTIKPFDNVNVRKAVVAASDRTALQLTRGGTAAGDLATHFLPPAFPGFDDAGGDQGHRRGLPRQPARRHGAGQEVHARGQEAGPEPADRRQRHVDRTPTSCSWSPATPTRARRRARSRRRSSRSSASRSTSAPRRRTPCTRSSATCPRRRS